MFSRALSLNRPPTNGNSRTKSRSMSKRASLNRPPNRRMSRLGSVVRSARRRVGSAANSMRSALGRVGPAINSMGLTRGSKRRHRNRKSKIRYNILENEIVTTIEENQEKTAKELKKELLRKLDEKLNFKTHSEEGYSTYHTCDRTEKNETLLDDYIFVTGQLSFSYHGIIKQILKEVNKEAESRINYCTPTDPKHTRY
jgi:vesicle coat complex subunit